MKQILLITDGCSNSGVSPVITAAQAFSEGISVNVIGILDEGHLGRQGAQEVAEIAEAGGGMSRIVYARQLSQTMQMMTRQTVAHTIHQIVNQQLQDVFGKPQMEDLAPTQKARVVEVMDQLQETMDLQISLLVDSSLSMKNKLPAIEEAIADLLLNVKSRKGKTALCVFHFPADDQLNDARLLLDWTTELAVVRSLFRNVEQRGVTPTGPAILSVLRYLQQKPHKAKVLEHQQAQGAERGLWSEYVV